MANELLQMVQNTWGDFLMLSMDAQSASHSLLNHYQSKQKSSQNNTNSSIEAKETIVIHALTIIHHPLYLSY